MRKADLFAVAALVLLLAACTPPPPTNGAFQPVDPATGTPQGGTSNPQ